MLPEPASDPPVDPVPLLGDGVAPPDPLEGPGVGVGVLVGLGGGGGGGEPRVTEASPDRAELKVAEEPAAARRLATRL